MSAGRRGGRPKLAAQQLSLVLVVVIMAVVFSLLTDRFADYDNLRNILLQSAATTIGASPASPAPAAEARAQPISPTRHSVSRSDGS